MARTSETTKAKIRSNSAKGKSRDKDLVNYDNKKIGEENEKNKKIEAFIIKILNRRGTANSEKAFFAKMIEDVKNGNTDGFTMDDFYFLTKFNISKKATKEACETLVGYFSRLCEAVELRATYQDDADMLLCYENFKKARGLLNIALPTDFYCENLEELEFLKKLINEAHKEGKYYIDERVHTMTDTDLEKKELIAFYLEFLKRADRYFQRNLPSRRYPTENESKQNAKNYFRNTLRDMDIFYKTKIAEAIDNSTLTQSICDYVTDNFADFLAEYKKAETDLRILE